MSRTETATTTSHPDSHGIGALAEGARKDVTATIESIRSTAVDVGDRMPMVVDGIHRGAVTGAREIDAWPESTRRLVAALSIGLGAGLAIAGAPRLVLAASLVPAVAVAAIGLRRDGSASA